MGTVQRTRKCGESDSELKYDFALEGFNMKEFFATEAAMRFISGL